MNIISPLVVSGLFSSGFKAMGKCSQGAADGMPFKRSEARQSVPLSSGGSETHQFGWWTPTHTTACAAFSFVFSRSAGGVMITSAAELRKALRKGT
jgi:hypothetical protein